MAEKKKVRVLLVCAIGMSSSLIEQKTAKVAEDAGVPFELQALDVPEVARWDFGENPVDIVLIAPQARFKKRSLEHESRWLNLIGFCLRPGFGDALDDHRIRNLWKIFNDGPVHAKNVQVRSEWWVLWRRVAGGLSANQQRQVLQVISAVLRPGKGGKKVRLAPQEHMEIWMAVANMERISPSDKVTWGSLLLKSLPPKKGRSQYWWSLSRLGAREPLYCPIDLVASPDEVTSWIESILSGRWRDPRPVGMALAQMARLTGDRGRDLKSTVIQRVIDWLTPYEWSGPYIKLLKEVVSIAPHEESLIFGESLPSGIRLRVD